LPFVFNAYCSAPVVRAASARVDKVLIDLTRLATLQRKVKRMTTLNAAENAFGTGDELLKKQNELLNSIRHAQNLFISGQGSQQAYEEILHSLVKTTDSAYGFLDEVLYEADGTPYKVSLALSDISWDEASRRLYQQLVDQELEFRNLNNLSGAPAMEGRTIIANDAPNHPQSKGLPKGHPPLTTYMGIPLYFGNEIIGVAGVANRIGGYTDEIADFIKPLTQACSAMIWAGRMVRREKENLAALTASEEKYRRMAETANEGIWIVDEHYRTTYVNRRMAEMLGYLPNEMMGKCVDRFVAPEDVGDHAARMTARQGGMGEIFERRYLHRDGSVVWTIASATPLLDSEGVFTGAFAMFTDITDRKRAEEALREERDRMQRYLDSTNTIIVALDESGKITMLNRYGLELLGYDKEEILGKNWFSFALPQPEGVEKVYLVFQEIMKGNIAQNRYVENDVLTAWGERRTIAWSNTHLCDESGRTVGGLSSGMDITEQKRAEAQVRQLQKAESLGRMAGAIAHHFNNKLGVVMGNLEMALEDLPENTRVREYLVQAMEGARLSAEVSRMMLTYLGQTRGRHEPLDFCETVRKTLPMLQAAMPGHVALTTELPVHGPFVEANANEMHQVLANILTNAWESVGEDTGAVHLIVRKVAASDIPKSHRFPVNWVPQDRDYVCLEIEDSGCGIATKDIEKLFDPFYSTKFTGRGLGLPTALGIVRAHQGGITVESRVCGQEGSKGEEGLTGSGSVFRVFLPSSVKEISRKPQTAATAVQVAEAGVVLLIEDEPQLREAVSRMMELMGFTVLAAKDGVEGIEIFRDRKTEIQFVLSDLTMPRMNGWETLAGLRELSPDIPVILTSGYDEATVMTGDHPESPQGFLSKPYGFNSLREAIGKVTAGISDAVADE